MRPVYRQSRELLANVSAPLHFSLVQKGGSYSRWHQNKYSSKVHKATLGMYLFVLIYLLAQFLPVLTLASAQTLITKSSTADFAQGTTTNLNTAGDELKLSSNDKHAWYATGGTWNYRKKITIDKTKVASTDGVALTDFPVLVNLVSDDDLAARAQDDGDDILFTGADEKTKLSHEIESFSGTTGALVAWVKLPHINKGNDTIFYMYYGNDSASSQQNVTDVWSNGYLAVWHMNQNPSGSAPQILNSVTNDYNWTTNGVMSSDQLVAGKNGQGLSFDGTNDYLQNVATSAFNLDTYTVEAWAKRDSNSSQYNSLFTTFEGGYYGYRTYLDNTGLLKWSHAKSDGTYEGVSFGSGIDINQWASFAVSKAGATITGYVNSSADSKTLLDASSRHVSPTNRVRSGYEVNNSAYFDGAMDELRFSNLARSADWIATEYANQNAPDTFASLGSEVAKTSLTIASDNNSTAWYSTDWGYRRKISIDYTKVSSDQYDFPTLVKIADSADPIFSAAQADGDDLLFTDAYGNKLSHEIETFDTTGKQLWAWVNVPKISSTANTVLYLYYGNSGATNQQSKTDVWIGNYKSVWHLKENPTATAPQFADSTSSANAATSNGSQASGDQQSAKINGGLNFDGSNDYLSAASPNLTTAATIEAWVKTDSGAKQEVASLQSDAIVLRAHDGSTTGPSFTVKIGGRYYQISTSELTIGSWYHLVGIYSNGSLKLYLNGTEVSSGSATGTLDSGAKNNIGVHQNGSANPFDGLMDEVRVSNVARSANWISTEYNNQNSPETFYSLGGQQGYYPISTAAGWYNSSWSYRQKITIDHTKVTGSLTDFPVLISLASSTNPVFAEAQADGDDILFTSSDGTTKLSHEIESFTPTSATKNLVAWVKVPSLSSSTDTILYLYYGNLSVSSQQNATNVWSNGYAGVWHMNQTGTNPVIGDSTSNSNNSTSQTWGPLASGKVGGAGSFNGSSNIVDIPNSNSLNISNSMTVGMWVYLPSTKDDEKVLRKQGTGDGGYTAGYKLSIYNNKFAFETRDGSGPINYTLGWSADNALSTGQWQYISAVYEYDATIKTYVNGQLSNTTNIAYGLAPSSSNLSLGGGEGTYYIGNLDNACISSTARSATWIATEYTNQNSPQTFYSIGQQENSVYYASPTSTAAGSGIIDTVWNVGWGTPNGFSANVTIPANTSIAFYARSSSIGGSTDADWTAWQSLGEATSTGEYTVANASMPAGLTTGANRYLQLKAIAISTDGKNSPTLADYSFEYLADNSVPTNPSLASATVNGNAVTDGVWLSSGGNVSISFSGASDSESVVSGYYTYFGTSSSGNPTTYQAHSGAANAAQSFSSTTAEGMNYFRVKTVDAVSNVSEPVTIISIGVDTTAPIKPNLIAANPAGYSTTNSFDFSWPAGSDSGSGIKWYEYKRATDANWSHTADANGLSVSGLEAYREGANTFYVRAVDVVGNNSDNTQVTYYWSGSAPPKPTNLTATPSSSDQNSFTFSWDKPAQGAEESPIIGYYYSINTPPTLLNSTYVASKDAHITIGPDSYATQQGENTFYVVSKNEAGNSSFLEAYYATTIFNCLTAAPPAPMAVTIYDTSDKVYNRFILTLDWQAGSGQDSQTFDHYLIERSQDGANFTELAQTTGTSYIDSDNLSDQITYYYRIKAVDDAGSTSAASTIVSAKPYGKYTQPPEIVVNPKAEIKTNQVVITWQTDRPSSSYVRYGKDLSSLKESSGKTESVISHEVILYGLEGASAYYYQVQSVDQNRDYTLESAYSTTYSFITLSAPAISNVDATNVTLNSADVSWETTTVSTSKILFGESNSYGQEISDLSSTGTTKHQAKLSNLNHSTIYHFKIISIDIDGNEIKSDDYSFETLPLPKIESFAIEQIQDAPTQTIKVKYSTNVPTSTIVRYWAESVAEKESTTIKLVKEHEVNISDLVDNSKYSISVSGRDSFGNLASTSEKTYETPSDTRAPKIGKIIYELQTVGLAEGSKLQVVASCETDEPSSITIEYGEGAAGEYTKNTIAGQEYLKNTVVIFSGLEPSKVYHARVVAKDKTGNISRSEDNIIVTGRTQETVLEVFVRVLKNVFGWMKI